MPSNNAGVALRHSDGHGDFVAECDVSDKYTDFIASHLDGLKEQCKHFTTCINKLLKDENPVHVLRGEDISLNKTCGLVYKNGLNDYSTLTGRCTVEERGYIREDLESHLKDKFLKSWNNVENCLSNYYGDSERTSRIDEICGLAREQPTLCGRYKIHKSVETFFNEQIHHLRCTCQNLNTEDDHSHSSMYIALACGAAGLLLLLVILALVIFCCYRKRRSKRKKRSANVIYLPAPNSDNNPVYQEVYDDRMYHPSPKPPTLPMRYTPHPTARQDDENAYLEPVDSSLYRPKLPPMRGAPVANPSYGAPPEYSEKDENAPKTRDSDADNGYFEPLPPLPTPEEDGGYDSLGRSKKINNPTPSGYETLESMAPAPPVPSSEPLGPVPAKRTKKEDRQTESHYFVLEKDEHSEV